MLERCAFSAVRLNCLTTAWAECVAAKTHTIPRTYADDISAIAKRLTAQVVRDELGKVYRETQTYARLSGGGVSISKIYTFGRSAAP